MTYGSPVSVTSIAAPQDLEASTVAIDEIALTWVRGSESNYTFIRRSYTSYPATIEDGTLVCNITGESYNDIGLTSYVRVYYRAWAYNESTNTYSLDYDSEWNRTGPANPTNIIGAVYGSDLNITWTLGRDASHTLVIRKVGSYPTSRTDGTELYNGTNAYYNDSNVLQTYRYRLYSYDDLTNLYSDGVNAPWGALDVNCYDEDTLDAINFNVLVTTDDGSQVYSADDCTNTYRISVGDLPTGDVGIHIGSADFYNNQSEIFTGYPYHQNTTTTYIQLEYAPNNKADTNVTCYNSTGTSESYPSFILTDDVISIYPDAADEFSQINVTYIADSYGHRWYYRTIVANTMYTLDSYLPPSSLKQLYVISVVDEVNNPIRDAYVVIMRELNGSYANVSNFYTNGYGQGSVYLIPDEPYKFVINLTGYETEYSDWTPSTSDTGHVFQLEYLEVEVQEPDDMPTFNGTRTNTTLTLTFDNRAGTITNMQFYVYEINISTGNETLFYSNTTATGDFTVVVSSLTRNNSYRVVLYYNHSLFGFQKMTLFFQGVYTPLTTPTEVNTLFQANYGTNPLGWSNFIMWIFLLVSCVDMDNKNAGARMVLLGGIFIFINTFIGFNTTLSVFAGGMIPILFIVVGIIIMWNDSRKKTN